MTSNHIVHKWAKTPRSCHKCGYAIHREYYVPVGKLVFHDRCVPENIFAYFKEMDNKIKPS